MHLQKWYFKEYEWNLLKSNTSRCINVVYYGIYHDYFNCGRNILRMRTGSLEACITGLQQPRDLVYDAWVFVMCKEGLQPAYTISMLGNYTQY